MNRKLGVILKSDKGVTLNRTQGVTLRRNLHLFDVIIHVAAIVHHPQCRNWNLYKSVNADLPIEIATIAKAHGAHSFIFFSTMGVYQAEKRLKPSVIDENTPLEPKSFYGKSKLLAEEGLAKLNDANFHVAIVRPPSVYGKGCKGGYITGFTRIARLLPVIPNAYNDVCQSFIYIDNLSECIRLIAEGGLQGVFCPQDDEAPNANRLLEVICRNIGKRYRSSRFLGVAMRLMSFIPIVRKAYGGIEYSRSLSDNSNLKYVIVPFEKGMETTLACSNMAYYL